MSARKMIPGLNYTWGFCGKKAEWFAEIDKHGGWPLGLKYCGFVHTDEREAGFCESPHNDGWWTVIAKADEYYLWKLSPEAVQRIVDAAISASRIQTPEARHLDIRIYGRDRAPLATPGDSHA